MFFKLQLSLYLTKKKPKKKTCLHVWGKHSCLGRCASPQFTTHCAFTKKISRLSGMEKNFRMQDGETFSLPYDATSIMHYGRYSTQNDKCILNCFSLKVMWYFLMITLVSGIFFQQPACPPSSQRKMWRKWDREINWQRLTLKGFDVSTAVVYSQLCSLHTNFICVSTFWSFKVGTRTKEM